MTNAILRGKPDAGNPHVRFDEGEVASAKPRRGSLLYKKLMAIVMSALSAAVTGSLFAAASNVAELREALATASNDAVIEVAAGTFEISEELTLAGKSGVTLKGAGKALTVFTPAKGEGGAAVDTRLLHVTNCPSFRLEGITFRGARRTVAAEGGAVRIENATNDKNLSIVNCAFIDNRIDAATGAAKGAGLSTYNCGFKVEGCDFISNVVYSVDDTAAGGAWNNSGTTGPLELVNCVFDMNGSLGYKSSGAGAFNTSNYKDDKFTNLLIVRNFSYVHKWGDSGGTTKPTAGAFSSVGGTFYNCTIAHNTSPAIYRPSYGGEIYYKDTIMWANGRYSINDARNQTNTILEPTVYGNNDNSARSTEDPKFVNGYHLASDSPAIDAGSRTAEVAGLTNRTVCANGELDTGMVDLGYHYTEGIATSARTLYVNSAAEAEGDGTEDAPYKTLTEALKHATNDSTILLASGTYDRKSGETFPIAPADILQLTIACYGETPAVFDNGGVEGARVFDFVGCHGVTLSNLVVRGGNVTATDAQSGAFIEGGGIRSYISVDIRLKDVSVESNVAGGSTTVKAIGGGVSVRGGSLIAERSSFGGNTARMGGGLFVYNGMLHVWDSFVTNNVAGGSGSGVYMAPIDSGMISKSDTVGGCDLRNVLLTGQSGSAVFSARAGRIGIFSCTVAGNNCSSWTRDSSSGPWSYVYDSIFVQNGTESSIIFSAGDTGNNILPGTDPKFESGFYLKEGSPAIDAGHTDVATWSTPNVINQGLRSWFVTKVDGTADTGTLDIGFHYPAGLVRETHLYFVDPVGGNDGNDGLAEDAALKTATAAFAKVREGDSVALMPGTYSVASGETFPLTLEGKADVSVFPTNAPTVTIDAMGSAHRVLTLKDWVNPSFRDIVFTGGIASNDSIVATGEFPVNGGGGVLVRGGMAVAFEGCRITGNLATVVSNAYKGVVAGGGVLAQGADVTFTGCVVDGNRVIGTTTDTDTSTRGKSGSCGGGIAVLSSNFTFNDGRISGNSVSGKGNSTYAQKGAGVYVGHGTFQTRNSLYAKNTGTTLFYSCYDPNGSGQSRDTAGKINAYFCTFAENGSRVIMTQEGYHAQKFYSCALSGNGRSEAYPDGEPETDTRPDWYNCLLPVGSTGNLRENGCILTNKAGIVVSKTTGVCKVRSSSPVVDASDALLNTYDWLTAEGALDNNGNPRIVGIKDKKKPVADIGCVEVQCIPGLLLMVR